MNGENTEKPAHASKPRHAIAEVLGFSILFIFIASCAYMLHLVLTPRTPAPYVQDKKSSTIDRTGTTDSTLLFERTARWGPCALPDPNACHDELTLSQDGVLRISSVKGPVLEKITPYNLEKIKAHIKSSSLLNKPCDAPIVADYSAHYRITLDGITRDIDFPGCQDDLKVIDDILNGA